MNPIIAVALDAICHKYNRKLLIALQVEIFPIIDA